MGSAFIINMETLQIFTRALEKATGHAYVSAVTYKPLRMPAYKEFTFTIKQMDGEIAERKIYQMNYRQRVTTDEEKEMITSYLTEQFIAFVLSELLKSK